MTQFISDLLKILKSRTVITIIVTFAINFMNIIAPFMPADVALLINTMLSALAVYFRISPQANF